MNKNVKHLQCILISIIILSCMPQHHSKLEDEIEDYLDDNFESDTCYFNISDVTDFKWDKFYIFNTSSSLEEIEKVLGLEYEYFEDVAKRYIFIDEFDRIIYHEDHFPYPSEGLSSDEVVFNIPDTVNYSLFRRHTLFIAVKVPFEKGTFYIVSQKDETITEPKN